MATNEKEACTLVFQSIISALEAGARSHPIFFFGPGCGYYRGTDTTGLQYPRMSEPLPDAFFQGTKQDLRNFACPGTSITQPRNMKDCPIPAIMSVYVPPNQQVQFFADPHQDINKRVQDLGQFNLSNFNSVHTPSAQQKELFPLRQNSSTGIDDVFNIDPLFQGKYKWASAKRNGRLTKDTQGNEVVECDYPNSDIISGPAPNMLKMSLLSCNAPFWPSLFGYNPIVPTPNSLAWPATVAETPPLRNPYPTGFCATNNLANNFFRNPAVYSRGREAVDECYKARVDALPIHTTSDCTESCTCTKLHYSQLTYSAGCSAPVSGSTREVQIQNQYQWNEQTFRYCVGLETLSVGGQKIQRYGQGTPFCDFHVPFMCKSSNILSNPQYEKACACVLESEQNQLRYQGIDLPVACFSDICSQSADPLVYRSSQQKNGCNAKICQQVVNVYGDRLTYQGTQKLFCNSRVYELQGTKAAISQITNITSSSSDAASGGISLVWLYVAICLLGFVGLILILWGLRKLTRRKSPIQTEGE